MKFIELQGLIQGSEQWKQWRNTGIGGSDAAVFMMKNGVYGKTPLQLWRQKMGYSEAVFSEVAQEHIERGQELEPAARQEFIDRTGIMVEPVCMQSASHPFMLASLDGMNADRTVGCEIKAPAEKMFLEMIENGTPEMYQWQIQWQLGVSGADEFYFFAYNPQVKPHIFIERHEPRYDQIQESMRKGREFWRHVELNIPPGDELGVDKAKVGMPGLTMFAGYAKAGKDTAGEAHQRIFNTKRYGFADPLKDVYVELSRQTSYVSREQLEKNKEKHRNALIALGHGMRQVDPDVWVRGVFNMNTGILRDIVQGGAVITDTRYVNEVSAGRRHAARLGMPFRLVWVQREGVGPVHETEAKTTSLLRNMADVVLYNDMDINEPVGRLATDMAVISIMNVIPEGKGKLIMASTFENIAKHEAEAYEPKRNTSRRKAR